jgi:multiple sugar transport system substrate-binding protein
MSRKKLVAFMLASVMIVSVFSGCAGKKANVSSSQGLKYNNEPVTLTFWHTYSADTEAKVFDNEVIADFNKQYPNIKINSVTMPSSNLEQQVIQAAASNSSPDLMRMDNTWIPQFANLNTLVQVDKLSGFSDVVANSFPGPVSSCQFQGKYYALPLDTNTQIAIYNTKDLQDAGLSEPPKTFDELISAAQKIKSTHPNGLIAFGTSTWNICPYFLSLGGTYSDPKYTKASGYINSKASVAALTKLVNANDQGLVGKVLLGGQPGFWDGLKTSDGYMETNDGPWFFSLQDKSVTNNYSIALMPSGAGGSISVIGGEDVAMFKNCKDQSAGWEFMKYLNTEFPQKTMAKIGQMPTNTTVANDPDLTSNPVFKMYMKQLKTGWARVPCANWAEMDNDLNLGFEKAFRHKDTVQNVLNTLAKQMDELFAENSK